MLNAEKFHQLGKEIVKLHAQTDNPHLINYFSKLLERLGNPYAKMALRYAKLCKEAGVEFPTGEDQMYDDGMYLSYTPEEKAAAAQYHEQMRTISKMAEELAKSVIAA